MAVEDIKKTVHEILNAAGITDEEIMGHIRLRDSGYEKISRKTGFSVEEIKLTIDLIMNDLKHDASHDALTEDEDDSDDSFMDEINAKNGTYNFLWKLNGQNGQGTAAYSNNKIKIIAVVDKDGNDIPNLLRNEEILKQAVAFIDKV